MKPQFMVGYRGQVEYLIGQEIYRERYFAHNKDGYYQKDVYEREIEPAVGTIMCDRDNKKFPPREVVAMFPGFVVARYREDWTIEYDGPKPKTHIGVGGWIWASEPKRLLDLQYGVNHV